MDVISLMEPNQAGVKKVKLPYQKETKLAYDLHHVISRTILTCEMVLLMLIRNYISGDYDYANNYQGRCQHQRIVTLGSCNYLK